MFIVYYPYGYSWSGNFALFENLDLEISMKKFFEALGTEDLSCEIDGGAVDRFIEEVLPDQEESRLIRQYYGICCQKRGPIVIGRENGLSAYQVAKKLGKAMYKLRRSPKTEEMISLAEEKRWSLKGKDLRDLHLQVRRLVTELFDVRRSLDLHEEILRGVRAIPQIADALRVQPTILDMKIDGLGFTNRLRDCLRSEGIWDVGQLVSRTATDLRSLDGIGHVSLNEIKEVLAVRGLELKRKF